MTPTPCTAVPENARPRQYYPNATAANTTCPDTLKVALPVFKSRAPFEMYCLDLRNIARMGKVTYTYIYNILKVIEM